MFDLFWISASFAITIEYLFSGQDGFVQLPGGHKLHGPSHGFLQRSRFKGASHQSTAFNIKLSVIVKLHWFCF